MQSTLKRYQKIFRAGEDGLISLFKGNSDRWEDRDGGSLYQDYRDVYQESSSRKAGKGNNMQYIWGVGLLMNSTKKIFQKEIKDGFKSNILENVCLLLKQYFCPSLNQFEPTHLPNQPQYFIQGNVLAYSNHILAHPKAQPSY